MGDFGKITIKLYAAQHFNNEKKRLLSLITSLNNKNYWIVSHGKITN